MQKLFTETSKGFTLVELMVTIAIAGVLVGIAIPSFTSIISNNRLTTSANELVTALNLARSEAVKRGFQVTVRRKGATSTQWESGWDIFVDRDGNNTFSDNGNATLCEATEDCLLKTYSALPGNLTLRTGNSSYKDYAAYLPNGLSKAGVGDTFTLCSDSGTSMPQRTIVINPIGRPRTSAATGTCP
ncbi:GspH/FimT family pseudopilin [Methylomonas sp. OY6]|uniref:Type II secretion system protein H n=1 Tax=Methylomonas defluvii TaxID=3045149 RepID=A0ABU4UA55_9GAMM|nr:GspH/FimT family pseudopilin [Methylomonas sp. OY6]MDX8126290.1 GspH/FimT family pseudopilin [Methylomonas sp. OY6]